MTADSFLQATGVVEENKINANVTLVKSQIEWLDDLAKQCNSNRSRVARAIIASAKAQYNNIPIDQRKGFARQLTGA